MHGLQYADDYITKPFGIMELISRVKALLRRSAYVEEKKFLTLGNVFMDDEKHAVYVSDQVCELTYKEYELLKLTDVQCRDCDCERYDHGAYLGH